jgi:hypothetical protein
MTTKTTRRHSCEIPYGWVEIVPSYDMFLDDTWYMSYPDAPLKSAITGRSLRPWQPVQGLAGQRMVDRVVIRKMTPEELEKAKPALSREERNRRARKARAWKRALRTEWEV